MAYLESFILRDSGGTIADVTASNALKVDGSAVTQPCSISSLPLPTGAATETTLASLLTELQLKADLTETQPCSIASLPLPTGAATEATLSSLNGKIPANLTVSSTRLLVDNSGVTQPVSGTFWQATQPVSIASSIAVTGPLTDIQLRTTPVAVSATQLDVNLSTLLKAADTLTKVTTVDTITNVVAVNDNGGSLTVDATDLDIRNLTPATDTVAIGDGVSTATVRNLASNDALNVALVDASGNQVTSFGGGTQYTEGDTDVSITGTAMMMEGPADTLLPVQGNVVDGVLVNLGANNDVTVTGSITANAGTNLNTSALALETTATSIKNAVETIDNAIAGSEMQVDVITMPTVTVQATNLDTRDLTFVADKVDASGSILGANSGVDIGDVTVNNAAGASAVNIQDGGNSLTVDSPGIPTALGQNTMANSMPVVIASNQSAVPVSMSAASVLFSGSASSFRTPGRAGTAGQKLMSIHNATGSAVTVSVKKLCVDMYATVVKAVTVPPPLIRIWKVTVLPTNGTTLTKNKVGGTTTSSASVTVLGDASVDGTNSIPLLTATLPAGTFIEQKFASRIITAVGEVNTRIIHFDFEDGITLAALEGLVIFLDYTVATMNPTTDMWAASIQWTEV